MTKRTYKFKTFLKCRCVLLSLLVPAGSSLNFGCWMRWYSAKNF